MVRRPSALRYVGDMGRGVPPNRPLVGGASCFAMGRVKSGWLSKIQDLNCSRLILEWSG